MGGRVGGESSRSESGAICRDSWPSSGAPSLVYPVAGRATIDVQCAEQSPGAEPSQHECGTGTSWLLQCACVASPPVLRTSYANATLCRPSTSSMRSASRRCGDFTRAIVRWVNRKRQRRVVSHFGRESLAKRAKGRDVETHSGWGYFPVLDVCYWLQFAAERS